MSYPYSADHPNIQRPDATESTPELPEINQEAMTLDVKGVVEVGNVVRTHEVPSRHAASRNYGLTEGQPVPLLGADKRRKRVTLVGLAPSDSTSLGLYVGEVDAVRAHTAALWPYGVPLTVEHAEQVYVMPEGTSLSAGHLVSFVAENWAD